MTEMTARDMAELAVATRLGQTVTWVQAAERRECGEHRYPELVQHTVFAAVQAELHARLRGER